MSAIYLRHPQHGEKVATMEAEAAFDEANGWVRFTPGLPVAAPFVAHIDNKANEASGAAIVKRRGGRPRKVT